MSNINPKLLFLNPPALARHIKSIGYELGFSRVRIAHPNIDSAAMMLKRWQQLDNAGEMDYMQRHGLKRGFIKSISPDCLSVISVALNYLSAEVNTAKSQLKTAHTPYISLYARNRDYHKILRKRLSRFADAIKSLLDHSMSSRAFVDSAPVLDKAYAEAAGIGWMGKHTNILNQSDGSFFFLGELAVNIKLPADSPVRPHCGSCRDCINCCPTEAIKAPYQLNVQKCISYLTIEYDGIIDDCLKEQMGNRIYGCDDCQLFCPWNRYAKVVPLPDFAPRPAFRQTDYATLLRWNEATFLQRTEGSPIRRIGHNRWQRNLAIAIGNSLRQQANDDLSQALAQNRNRHAGVKDAVEWAKRQGQSDHLPI